MTCFTPFSLAEEGAVVLDWLSRNGVPFWTPSPAAAAETAQRLREERARLGLKYRIHYSDRNPMLFFEV